MARVVGAALLLLLAMLVAVQALSPPTSGCLSYGLETVCPHPTWSEGGQAVDECITECPRDDCCNAVVAQTWCSVAGFGPASNYTVESSTTTYTSYPWPVCGPTGCQPGVCGVMTSITCLSLA